MREEKLSGRQLSVAVLVGGLSTAAAVAGGIDWRWMLAAVLPVVGIGWLLLRRVGGRPLHPAVRVAYCVWSVVLAADVLRRAAERIQQAAGGGTDLGWLLVLLALPLLWMGWGKAGAFFRAGGVGADGSHPPAGSAQAGLAVCPGAGRGLEGFAAGSGMDYVCWAVRPAAHI